MENNTDRWYEFYKNRINSGYQAYFEKRYSPFLNLVMASGLDIIEAGVGIGSVSKYTNGRRIIDGFDISPNMVKLAKENTGYNFKVHDIRNPYKKNNIDAFYVTHGVLEHFSDAEIVSIIEMLSGGVHYVPLDKYKTPSFGDERLLPLDYWLSLLNPETYIVFNDGYDLAFKI